MTQSLSLDSINDHELLLKLEHNPLGLIEWDQEFRVTHWSKRSEEIFGWTAEEVMGKKPNEWNFIHESDMGPVEELIAELGRANDSRAVSHNRNYTKDGRIVYCAWHNSVQRSPNGQMSSVFSLIQDETEAKMLSLALEKEKARADSANALKSAFLANMSHEIRTPLGVILGFSELLADPDISFEDRAQFMATITRNGQLLSRLIDDILDLTKVESGKIDVHRVSFHLRDLIEDIQISLRPRAHAKGLEFEVHISSDVPNFVETDRVHFQQVISNLVGNAVKYTDSGYVRLTVNSSIHPDSPRYVELRICVEDSGAGIPLALREKIFEPFSQGERAFSKKSEGAGLGLAIASRLACSLGGNIRLLNTELGKGSVFEFKLLVPIGTQRPSVENVPRLHSKSPRPLSGLRILLADDSKDSQILIDRVLSKMGAEVETVGSGEEAIARALSLPFDMILMDIQMPGISGYEATQILRKKSFRKPIVALTAHAMKDERARSLEAGCDEHLAKPVTPERLVATILIHTTNASEWTSH